MKRTLLLLLAHAFLLSGAGAAEVPSPASAFGEALSPETLDESAFSQWVDGGETPLGVPPDEKGKNGLSAQNVIWTSLRQPNFKRVIFGKSGQPGPRHLRIGFTGPVPTGSVLVLGGGRLSILKPDAASPGDLGDESQWLPAHRLVNGKVSTDEVKPDEIALWTLPPGTATRALRFTHEVQLLDNHYEGSLSGVLIMAERWANLAPVARVATPKGESAKLNNNVLESWSSWENIPYQEGFEGPQVSPERPEWIILSWGKPVRLKGLVGLFAGFGAGEIQVLSPESDAPVPQQAPEDAWKTVGRYEGVNPEYPGRLWPNWLALDGEETTRAVRLRMTAVFRGGHPHISKKHKDGQRVWLGELMALSPLGDQPLRDQEETAATPRNAPVPVEFTTDRPGYVTLVIEDSAGNRVRNLIAETRFEAGNHRVYWDGIDESLRLNPRVHGIYDVGGKLVDEGSYTVRGLLRDEVEMFYEMTPFNAGTPPWRTLDDSGAWLADHSPPSDVIYLPSRDEMVLCAHVPESGHGIIWIKRDGTKRTGLHWVGGNWTGASRLAVDAGPQADPAIEFYTASHWKPGELRLNAVLPDRSVKTILTGKGYEWGEDTRAGRVGGFAAHDGLLAISLPMQNRLEFVDAKQGKLLGKVEMEKPEGLAFDREGALYVLTGREVRRYRVAVSDTVRLSGEEVVIGQGLEEPAGITLHEGNLLVADRGESQQVKVFSATGTLLKTIGTPGRTLEGPYDPTRMSLPQGLAVTPDGKLWVAEADPQIKRTSVYNLNDGAFLRAFHGPARYGSGGFLDSTDRNRFYYMGMEFAIDWEKGTDRIASVYLRPSQYVPEPTGPTGASAIPLPHRAMPEYPIHLEGRQYMSDVFNESEVSGADPLSIWLMVPGGRAKRVATFGTLRSMEREKVLEKHPELLATLPETFNLKKDLRKVLYAWSDLNDNGLADPEEIQLRMIADRPAIGSFTLDDDLAITTSFGYRFPVRGFTPGHAPRYDLATGRSDFPEDLSLGFSSGGGQALRIGDGFVVTGGPILGIREGKVVWTYPSKWPSLHAGHSIPNRAMAPGEMAGTTRLLGPAVTPRKGDAGPLWALNADPGMIYLVTADGLFITTLGTDLVQGQQLRSPIARRGMKLENINFIGENFLPTINQLADGSIYLVCGKTSSNLIRVEGLESVRRITGKPIRLTAELRQACREYHAQQEAAAAVTDPSMEIAISATPPAFDGKLTGWDDADWKLIYEYSETKKADRIRRFEGAARVSGDTLYLAWRTPESQLITNGADSLVELFKRGGALDLMLGTDPDADPKRTKAVAGDLRLLVARVGDQVKAGLYRPVDPVARREKREPVAFSSPWRTITFDSVTDVSERIELKNHQGNFELAIPLDLLGLKPRDGLVLRGDIGILRGQGSDTIQRLYWHNKATTLISDVPGEAELAPKNWGQWHFAAPRP